MIDRVQDIKPLILVVDDDPDACAMLSDALEHEDMATLTAQNGEAAQPIASNVVPDLILMDAVMPGMSGFEACIAIKAQAHLAHIPVIFMTGLSETEHVVKGLRAGGVDYVTKPIVLDELFARIRVHLANARATQSARAALDAVGRSLLTADEQGRLLWCTPQAGQLLTRMGAYDSEALAGVSPILNKAMMDLIAKAEMSSKITLTLDGRELELSYLGRQKSGESFFRLAEVLQGREEEVLRTALGLTAREADVLLWVSRGKSNRDASQILNISPRTVNKHLEQIFEKLGVENRAAAAVVAARVIAAYN